MGIFIALIPMLMWGLIPLITTKLGGNYLQHAYGIALGAFAFASIAFIFVRPEIPVQVITVGFISGMLWSIGFIGQFSSLKYIDISIAMPVSIGMQLIGITLVSIVLLNEWQSTAAFVICAIAMILLLVSTIIIYNQKKLATQQETSQQSKDEKLSFNKGMNHLIISSIGYVGYVSLLAGLNINIWQSLLPLSVGMLFGCFIMVERKIAFNISTIKNIAVGVVWMIGNIALFLSTPRVGITISYTLALACIVVSNWFSDRFLGKQRNEQEAYFIKIATLLIIVVIALLLIAARLNLIH